jgi:isoleucyl-tRNA synthetase
VDPWDALEEHGADAIRFFLVASSHPWIPKRWDPEGLVEANRRFFDTLRNTYRFFALYAGLEAWRHDADGGTVAAALTADGETRSGPHAEEAPAIDRWLLSRLDTLAGRMGEELEAYDLTRAARRLSSFVVDDLSNWYVRRTRDRFWATDDDPGGARRRSTERAFATLHEALTTSVRLLAPIAPFLSDWLHRELVEESVHLADYPRDRGRRDPELEREMADARKLAALGRAAREESGLRVRQPLREMKVVVPGGRRLSEEVTELLRDEVNVGRVSFLDADDAIVRLVVKPDFSALGPRFEGDAPRVAEAVGELGDAEARRLRGGASVMVELDGDRVEEIGPDEVKILEEARGGLAVGSEEGFVAALDTTLDEELLREGLAREVVSRVQRLRRDAGLHVADRIRLAVEGTDPIRAAARAHGDYIRTETLATELTVADDADGFGTDMEHSREVEIEGERVRLGLTRAPAHGDEPADPAEGRRP